MGESKSQIEELKTLVERLFPSLYSAEISTNRELVGLLTAVKSNEMLWKALNSWAGSNNVIEEFQSLRTKLPSHDEKLSPKDALLQVGFSEELACQILQEISLAENLDKRIFDAFESNSPAEVAAELESIAENSLKREDSLLKRISYVSGITLVFVLIMILNSVVHQPSVSCSYKGVTPR